MKLFSIKLRASMQSRHVSGAERVVPEEKLQKTINTLFERLKNKTYDFLNIKVEEIKEKPLIIKNSLNIVEMFFKYHEEANKKAIEILHAETGINRKKLEELINSVHTGCAPDGSNMRGAMVVNQNGERIEPDRYRGVRTTNVDFVDRSQVEEKIKKAGYTERTVDALAITTKNLYYPDIIAEYCISDEPDYIIGYLSVKNTYYRMTPLKKKGNPKGGRIYFVKNGTDIKKLQEYLENRTVLIEEVKIDREGLSDT
ncbi:6-carboxyhexanoate--CoA ligase [Persephonella sp.]